MNDPRPKNAMPRLGNIVAWTATQNEDGTGELTIHLSDGGRIREWCEYLATLWAGEPENG